MTACYILFSKMHIVYVGASTHVETRIGGHAKKTFDYYTILPCRRSQMDRMERELIAQYKPKLNCTSGVWSRSGRFAKRILNLKRGERFIVKNIRERPDVHSSIRALRDADCLKFTIKTHKLEHGFLVIAVK